MTTTEGNASLSVHRKYILEISPTCVFYYFKTSMLKAGEDLKSCPETPRSLTSPPTSGLDLHLKFDIKGNSLLQQRFVLPFRSYFRDNLS